MIGCQVIPGSPTGPGMSYSNEWDTRHNWHCRFLSDIKHVHCNPHCHVGQKQARQSHFIQSHMRRSVLEMASSHATLLIDPVCMHLNYCVCSAVDGCGCKERRHAGNCVQWTRHSQQPSHLAPILLRILHRRHEVGCWQPLQIAACIIIRIS